MILLAYETYTLIKSLNILIRKAMYVYYNVTTYIQLDTHQGKLSDTDE